MNRTSFFIENKALFGSFPDKNNIIDLENNGVKYFVDLTCKNESGIERYNEMLCNNSVYIQYEITDHNIPKNWKTFSTFIIYISNIITKLNEKELIYIHCKGGHGRSCIVVSCILCYLHNISPTDSINYINICHNNRIDMKDKWRRIGFPQAYYQEKFIYNFFSDFYINEIFKNRNINIPQIGIFDINYILNNYINYSVSSSFSGETSSLKEACKLKNKKIINNIIKLIFKQHKDIENILSRTGLRYIKYLPLNEVKINEVKINEVKINEVKINEVKNVLNYINDILISIRNNNY
jgi:hypothetical protein